jgi:hypothetical protein
MDRLYGDDDVDLAGSGTRRKAGHEQHSCRHAENCQAPGKGAESGSPQRPKAACHALYPVGGLM